ncbi:MAG: hypothetical protein M3N82_02740 [Pseudomonadota bacterium]|nr:hypothetical protein [Pseudomonadota bacterium]
MDWSTDGELALSLSDRLAGAPSLRQLTTWPTGFEPKGQKCHANAERWVLLHPSWRAVRGWVLLCNEPFGGGHYAAHSVVEDPAGVLWDVTLADGITRSFLEHLGDLAVFMLRVTEGRWTIVREPLGLDADWCPQLE